MNLAATIRDLQILHLLSLLRKKTNLTMSRPSINHQHQHLPSIDRIPLSSTAETGGHNGKISPPTTSKTSSLPIHIQGSMRRTPSEVQLLHQEALADYRDNQMYERIFNGVSQRSEKLSRDCSRRGLFSTTTTGAMPPIPGPPEYNIPAIGKSEQRLQELRNQLSVQDLIRTRNEPVIDEDYNAPAQTPEWCISDWRSSAAKETLPNCVSKHSHGMPTGEETSTFCQEPGVSNVCATVEPILNEPMTEQSRCDSGVFLIEDL